jgi:hypothetical protein
MCWTVELDSGEVASQSFENLLWISRPRIPPEHRVDRRKRRTVAGSKSVRCRRVDVLKSCAVSGIHSGSSALPQAFLSRTSLALDPRPTNRHIYFNNMAPPQTGPKKSSRRSRKARTEGMNKSRTLPVAIHWLTSGSLFVLGIVLRLRQRRLDLKLRAQTARQTAFQSCVQGGHEDQKKRQPFACRGNSASS